MRRAYEPKVVVTGSRILRSVDRATGAPNVGFVTVTVEGDAARTMLRNMAAPMNARN